MKRLSALVTTLLLLTGCAASTTQTGLASTGQGLIAVGTQFVNVASVYTAHCKAATPPAGDLGTFCTSFKDFAPRFQATYPVARATWESARRANDTAAAQGAEATVLGLATDLSTLALQAATAIGGK